MRTATLALTSVFQPRIQNLRFLAVLAILALTMPLAAHADSVGFNITGGTFRGNGTPGSGGTFSGSFTLDTATDLITAFNISMDADGFDLQLTEVTNDGNVWFAYGNFQNGRASFVLAISPSTTNPQLCGVSPLPGCTAAGFATIISYNGGRNSDVANGGTITAITPEPSSIALLGTGILGTAGVIRRRIFTR